jgi:hypothetical protein
MDLSITSTGKTFYQFPSDVGAALCEAFPAAFARAVDKAAPPAPTPKGPHWSIVKLPCSGNFAIQLTRGAEVVFFDDFPDQAVGYFSKHFGAEVPAEIVAQYRSALGDAVPNARLRGRA